MKSTEVYKALREVLGPWCKQAGFKRTTGGVLGWHRPLPGGLHQVFWFQCSQDGWDPYRGSKFIVEFQVSGEPAIGVGLQRRRLPRYLDADQLEQVRALQNEVIRRLPKPPTDYFLLQMEDLADWYRAAFRERREPYASNEDIWLRYHQPEDVRRWAEWLLPHLPHLLERGATEAGQTNR